LAEKPKYFRVAAFQNPWNKPCRKTNENIFMKKVKRTPLAPVVNYKFADWSRRAKTSIYHRRRCSHITYKIERMQLTLMQMHQEGVRIASRASCCPQNAKKKETHTDRPVLCTCTVFGVFAPSTKSVALQIWRALENKTKTAAERQINAAFLYVHDRYICVCCINAATNVLEEKTPLREPAAGVFGTRCIFTLDETHIMHN
jgi:hypothetical protein